VTAGQLAEIRGLLEDLQRDVKGLAQTVEDTREQLDELRQLHVADNSRTVARLGTVEVWQARAVGFAAGIGGVIGAAGGVILDRVIGRG